MHYTGNREQVQCCHVAHRLMRWRWSQPHTGASGVFASVVQLLGAFCLSSAGSLTRLTSCCSRPTSLTPALHVIKPTGGGVLLGPSVFLGQHGSSSRGLFDFSSRLSNKVFFRNVGLPQKKTTTKQRGIYSRTAFSDLSWDSPLFRNGNCLLQLKLKASPKDNGFRCYRQVTDNIQP